jgi:hypothetical protein
VCLCSAEKETETKERIRRRTLSATIIMMQFFDVLMHEPGVGLRFSRHSPDWRVTQNFYSPNQRKTRQNNVFAEHLYSVKIDHHDCVCVIIMNKSPCQVCVCTVETSYKKAGYK